MSNYITVYGNLTRDPEVRRTTSDMAITAGGIASSRREKRGDEPALHDARPLSSPVGLTRSTSTSRT